MALITFEQILIIGVFMFGIHGLIVYLPRSILKLNMWIIDKTAAINEATEKKRQIRLAEEHK